MIEALWSVVFNRVGNHGPLNHGAGVVVFETERIFGGDSRYFYTGNYSISNGVATAMLTSTHYAGLRESIIGPDEITTFQLTGKIEQQRIAVSGHVVGQPNVMVMATLTRRAELP
uniref:Uncharacterized protein n=1 Tax=mine drainage metagenome TaxID=410659 RepID=E6QC99_9ZZZZ